MGKPRVMGDRMSGFTGARQGWTKVLVRHALWRRIARAYCLRGLHLGVAPHKVKPNKGFAPSGAASLACKKRPEELVTDLHFRSAVNLAKAIRDREVGARELLEHFIDRVDRYNPKINAVVVEDRPAARA